MIVQKMKQEKKIVLLQEEGEKQAKNLVDFVKIKFFADARKKFMEDEMSRVFKNIIIVLLVISVIGCSTMVTIQSDPPGADVFINNQKKGTTPYIAKLDDFALSNYLITLKKEGYNDFNGTLAKEAKVGAIIGGILFVLPFLWCYGPSPYQQFTLEAKSEMTGSIIKNNQVSYEIIVNEKKLSLGDNFLESGFHQVAFYKNGDFIASGTFAFNNGEYYEFKL